MADEDLHHAHDKLFKEGFSDPVNTAAFLRHELPPEVSALIEWDQLRLIPGSFLDDALRHSESDLLFTVPLAGHDVCLHLLFEHQSTRDPRIALRLLRYMVRIWDDWERTHGKSKPLPVIVPVVIAQDRRVWNIDPHFASLFAHASSIDALRRYLPDFAFRLIEIAAIPFAAIRGTPDGIFVLRVLKAARIGRLLGASVWKQSLLAQVSRRIFDRAMHYLLTREKIDRPAFIGKLKAIRNPSLRNSAMTLAQKIRQARMRKGRMEERTLSRRQS